MNWKHCGYFTLTKDGTKVSVVVHHIRYVLNLEEVKAVVEGKLNYTLIYEPEKKEVK